ncbi:MAG: hypothetical protein U0457_07650 [Candidatus Sericytochromatia bacterium]
MLKIEAKLIIPFAFFILSAFNSTKSTFEVISPSKKYTANFSVEKCENDLCNGKSNIKLFKNKKLFQTFSSEDLNFFLDKKNKPSINIIQLYNEQSPLIFLDFNFDGEEDLAIRNGNNSGYGGPSYDIYLFDKNKKKFSINKALTEIASTNLGMFKTDTKRKRIIAFSKSGCCWHKTIEYAVKSDKPIELYKLTEDATQNNGELVEVTTEIFKNNKWSKTIKKYKSSEYYKN